MYDQNWITKILQNRKYGLIYAFYIGFGVSTNIHWLSDFVAGIFLGYCVGKASSMAANERWLVDDRINEEYYNLYEEEGFDREFKYTFIILIFIVFFSIVIPRKVLNL